MQHTITINKISHANSTQDITDSIKRFLQTANNKTCDITIIAPTNFIAERLYKEFGGYMNACRIQTLCFYQITLNNLLSSEYSIQRNKWQNKLNITYINKVSENPLEVFVNKVVQEAEKIREKRQKEKEKQPNIVSEIANASYSFTLQVSSGSMMDLDNINSAKINQEKIRKLSFFEAIELLDYTKAYIPKEHKLNFTDIQETDSIGIVYIKEFFIDIAEVITTYYEAYIEDKSLRDKKIEDIKVKLIHARNEILTNLSNTEQNKADNERRVALLIALKIGVAIINVCLSLGSGGAFILLALSLGASSVIREMYDNLKELDELESNRYYRAIAVPILTAFFKDISEALAICLVESHIFMLLDSNGNFIDLSGIRADYFIHDKSFNLTLDYNQILQGKYHGSIQNIIDILTPNSKNKQSYTTNDNKYSSLCISPIHRDSKTKSPAYSLFNTLTQSYINLVSITHPSFTSKILATAIKGENTTTKSSKNYITLTPPPDKQRAGSMEQAIKEMGLQIQDRPNPPKLTNNNLTQDYSSYKHDDMDLNNIFLYISPFIKINQTKKGEYKDNKALSGGDRKYIQSLMLQDENLDSIKKLQQTFIKEHIEYYKFLFDSVKYKEYRVNNNMALNQEAYLYTPENIFLKALILYYLEQDGAEIKKGLFRSNVYAEAEDIDITFQGRKTEFLVQYNQYHAIPIDLVSLKDNIKKAIDAYTKNANNDYEIVLGNSLGKITLHPFSKDINKLSFKSISNSIQEQYIGFSDENLDKALPLIMQSIGENILTNFLPSTKIFFANTESKELEALSILFITFSFALYLTQSDNKFTLSILSVATNTKAFLNLPNIIKNATLETLEQALNTTKDSIHISQNEKKNTQIKKLLNTIDIENSKAVDIRLDRAGNKLIINNDGNKMKLAIIDNNNQPIKQPTHITIQTDNTKARYTAFNHLSKEIVKPAGAIIIVSIADAMLTNIIQSLFTTDSKELLERYNKLVSKLQLLHNAPLVVDNDTFFTYPMPISSRMIVYNFAYGLFGGSLSTGGLEIAPNILLYTALQKQTSTGNITNQSAFTRHLLVKQILAFIVPDELRGGMEDKDFYQTILAKELSPDTLKSEYRLDRNNKRLKDTNKMNINEIIQSYNLDTYQCKKQDIIYKPNADVIVDSYNFCIDYLTNILNDTPKTTQTRKFVESIRNIAKNNILALYEGVSETNKVNTPKIFGRIATTIMQQDGLYLG